MELLLLCMLIGVLPAYIAHQKGRSFIGWWIYGTLLFIVAIVHVILLRPDAKAIEAKQLRTGEMKKCPACAELVKADANVCRHCGADVSAVSVATGGQSPA